MGLTHFDQASREQVAVGHLRGSWTDLGTAANSVNVGVTRIEVAPGGWSTPAHEHGREEEIFYVLSGSGLSWLDGATTVIGAGDCIVYPPGGGAHTLHTSGGLDVLAFGPREGDESPRFPRLGLSLVGGRAVETLAGLHDGIPIQWLRESSLGAPELAAPGPRPSTIVNVAEVEASTIERPRVVRTRRDLGRAVGSVTTGLVHFEVAAGKESNPQHCHSIEEEIFVILDGDGVLVLDQVPTPVRPGHVIACPAATGIAHVFRAGERGLTYLAYGTREPGDVCYYPRSNKVAFRGVGLLTRLEQLDYWDAED